MAPSDQIVTGIDRDGLVELASSTLPGLRWRRGESEFEGAILVTGRNDAGLSIRFTFYDDEPGRLYLDVRTSDDPAVRTADPGPAIERLHSDLVPAITAVPVVAPPPRPASTDPRVVVDLDRYLPLVGEDTVTTETIGDDLVLRVGCLSEHGGPPIELTTVFTRVAFHLEETVPGRSKIATDGPPLEYGLVADLGDTAFLRRWARKHRRKNRAGHPLGVDEARHFHVWFWEAGVSHHVVAASAELRDVVR